MSYIVIIKRDNALRSIFNQTQMPNVEKRVQQAIEKPYCTCPLKGYMTIIELASEMVFLPIDHYLEEGVA
jgi:hypothetical protein